MLWVQAQDKPRNVKELGSTLQKVMQKLSRFLQLHDQKTSGIPGLFPAYMGMRARVNEKIAKSKHLTILKHSSCEIVGWRLHPADELSDSQPERVLHHLMQVIFLHFLGEKWQIHPNLPPGI